MKGKPEEVSEENGGRDVEVRLFAAGVLPGPEGTGTETGDLMEGDPNRFEGREGRLCNSSIEPTRQATFGVPHS